MPTTTTVPCRNPSCMSPTYEASECTLRHNHYWDVFAKKERPGDYWVEMPCGHRQRLLNGLIPKSSFGAIQKVRS